MLNSVLEALEEGRLIELPDNDKEDALEVLGSLLEVSRLVIRQVKPFM